MHTTAAPGSEAGFVEFRAYLSMSHRCRSELSALAATVAWIFAVTAPSFASDDAVQSASVHADNISASLVVSDTEAVLTYRFFGDVTPPLSEIRGTINGHPLLEPSMTAYPVIGAKAAILLMLDTTDPGRERQIARDKLDVFTLLNMLGPHEAATIGVYGEKLEIAELISGNPGKTANAVTALAPVKHSPAMLGAVLVEAIKLIGADEADVLRRDIILFTDGHTDDSLDIQDVISRANRAGAAISFVLSVSQRQVDIASLIKISAQTGGHILIANKSDELSSLMKYINSGGVLHFPLGVSSRYFWQYRPEVKFTFVRSDKQLAIAAVAPLPMAGPVETARHIETNHPLIAGGTGAALLVFVAIFFARRSASRWRH